MWLIFAEAAGAFLILALIVWWTMFSGKNVSKEPPNDEE